MHVDRAAPGQGGDADPGGEQPGDPAPAAGPEHELGGFGAAGELEQRGRDVVAEDLVVTAAHALDEGALAGQLLGARSGQAVAAGDVDGEQVRVLGPGGDAGRAAQQRVALPSAAEGHHDAFPGLPRHRDVMVGAVAVELLVDLVGQPDERDLAQGGEVADPEVVGQGGVDALTRVDVAVHYPPAQRLRGHVDQLDLVGPAHDLVGDGLLLRHPGDLLDDVVDRFQVLDVDGGDHGDAGVEQLLDVLPAFGVGAAGHVGVGELVDQRDLRMPGQHSLGVELGEARPPVGQHPPGDDLQAFEQLGDARPAVRFDEADDDVGAPGEPAPALVEHRVGLADAGGRAQVDPELASRHRPPPFA